MGCLYNIQFDCTLMVVILFSEDFWWMMNKELEERRSRPECFILIMIESLKSTAGKQPSNKLWDLNFLFFFIFLLLLENGSNLVIFAITCQNNLCPAPVPPHWIVKQLRQSSSTTDSLLSRTKDFHSGAAPPKLLHCSVQTEETVFWKDCPWKSKVVSVGAGQCWRPI